MILACLLLLIMHITTCSAFVDIQEIINNTVLRFPVDFPLAVKDMAEGLSTKTITVVRGNSTNIR